MAGQTKNPSTPVSRQKNYRPVQIDKLISRIAEKLDFAFAVVVAPRGMYGKKESSSGEWDGVIGDLARGETDLVVADLTMTSEREEVIDFVSPYFDQDLFSIVLIRIGIIKTAHKDHWF